ncbi:DUF6515 family protein [Paucibacter sp. R3-3]|uniref:DUF6515 family protein n=1 Tax=Roseateles agri TaxID=3098619 RepID=A0ABU5DI60_9BURK|nr:DUF6515 family protein [Paucibacter sp. R3-3]MDY0744899.1 DUF6515 family protein [Paucibacter sp. R3-3]
MKIKTPAVRAVLIATVLAMGANFADAQRHDRDHERGGPPPRGWVIDHRYHHDHYYPPVGFYAGVLPVAALTIAFGAEHYWYHGGIWYRPYGGGYRVVVPPFGAVIPVLPSDYVTLTMGGVPYYYANGVYYSVYSNGPGYVVVQPPAGIDGAQVAVAAPVVAPVAPPPPAAKPDPIIYPRNGQSAAQTEADRQECNRWATTQPSAMNSASVFSRAVEACMDGRGYTMK